MCVYVNIVIMMFIVILPSMVEMCPTPSVWYLQKRLNTGGWRSFTLRRLRTTGRSST